MKLVYFAPNIDLSDATSGVVKKIHAQAKAFARENIDVVLIGGDSIKPRFGGDNLLCKAIFYLLNVVVRITVDRKGYKRALSQIITEKPQLLYVRYSYFSVSMFYFFKQIKNKVSFCKSTLEIPTWPYDKERKKFDALTIEDVFMRKKTVKYVDRIVTFCREEKILRVKTILISNGIDTASVKIKESHEGAGGELRLIGVSNLQDWTGYDRILAGISNYRWNSAGTRVHFDVVGDGSALLQLRSLSENYGLQDFVKFHGHISGTLLDKLFDDAHLAVGNLANHRKNLWLSSDLKHREYCARGIPFLTSSNDNGFPVDFPYKLLIPADDRPVNIHDVLAFYGKIKAEHPGCRNDMRRYAEENLDWTVVMRPVVAYFNHELGGQSAQ